MSILTQDSKGRKIIYVDASALKDIACLRKFYWSTIEGWQLSRESRDIKMAYGTAFHLALQTLYSKGRDSIKEAMQGAIDYLNPYIEFIGEDEFRTPSHLIQSVKSYYDRYFKEDGHDGLVAIDPTAVELKWNFPYWQNDQYVIILCGTIDLIAKYFGVRTIVDHKTTASWKPESYFSGYQMDIQTMFYTWMDNHINNRGDIYLPVMINGIFIKKPTQKAAKEGLWDGVTFERSQSFEYTASQMKQFDKWLKAKLNLIIYYLTNAETMESIFELSFCRTPYGLCKYFNVCSAANTDLQKEILSRSGQFENVHYNPLTWRD